MARFKKGESGNPLGKPKGTGKIQYLRDQITASMPEIIDTLIIAAKAGDTSAAKILIDKSICSLKPQDEPVRFDIASNDTLASTGQAIIDCVSRGEIAPDVGGQILAALGSQAKLVETNDLAKRIEALESLK